MVMQQIVHYVVFCDGEGCDQEAGGFTDPKKTVAEARRLGWSTIDLGRGRFATFCPKCAPKKPRNGRRFREEVQS
jgi:hypothetical protein